MLHSRQMPGFFAGAQNDSRRDLKGVIEREKSVSRRIITLREPTKPMLTEAAAAGFYESKEFSGRYPRLQILTIAELLAGKKLEYPTHRVETFAKAEHKTKTEGVATVSALLTVGSSHQKHLVDSRVTHRFMMSGSGGIVEAHLMGAPVGRHKACPYVGAARLAFCRDNALC